MANFNRGKPMKLLWSHKNKGMFTDFTNGDKVVIVLLTVMEQWLEDDDDFRVILQLPVTHEDSENGHSESSYRTSCMTTQQTTQRMLLKLIPSGNMRNIVSLVMKNPEINIAGMARVLELSPNGIKYHIKQIRKSIAFKHVGPWNAGHWEIGSKETS